MAARVGAIAAATEAQSLSVREVSGSVDAIGAADARNAAMLEETNRSIRALKARAEQLSGAIGRFDDRGGTAAEDSAATAA